MSPDIFEKTDNYIASLIAPEDQALEHALQAIRDAGMPEISISASQGKLLQVLALSNKTRRILELGTLGAYSTIWLARILPANGQMETVEYDPHHAQVAQANIAHAGLADKVTVHTGTAKEVLQQLISNGTDPFDFIFIDADKPPYKEYFELALQLSLPGTIIVCDNVIREGEVLNEHSSDERVLGVQRLNQFVSQCPAVTATILQTVGVKGHDGMVIAIVK